jgi:hypothetical protein
MTRHLRALVYDIKEEGKERRVYIKVVLNSCMYLEISITVSMLDHMPIDGLRQILAGRIKTSINSLIDKSVEDECADLVQEIGQQIAQFIPGVTNVQ